MRTHLFALLALICLAAASGDLAAEATLQGVNLGTYVTGPKVSAADLTGRVVLFEYWGVNCPPCVASIHHVTDLQAKYGRENFIVIANHCQGGGIPGVVSTWKGKATNDLVSVIDNGQLPGSNVSGIPRCFLFSHDGKVLYDGAPMGVDSALDAAMKASPGALVTGHDFTKLGREAAAIGAQKTNLAATLKSVRKAAEGDKPEAKEDADFLLGRVTAWASDLATRCNDDRTQDPARCQETVNRMVGLLKGDECGAPFEALQDELKTDKAFQNELKAAAILAGIKAEADKCKLSANPEQAKSQKSNIAAITAIAGNLKQLQKKFPDTAAAKSAEELGREWGL